MVHTVAGRRDSWSVTESLEYRTVESSGRIEAPVTASPALESIDMTTPVTSVPGGNGTYTVSFSMPSGWIMDTLPQPNDDRVRLVENPARLVLANRFRGRSDAKRIAMGSKELLLYAADNSLVTLGEPIWAGYSAPC